MGKGKAEQKRPGKKQEQKKPNKRPQARRPLPKPRKERERKSVSSSDLRNERTTQTASTDQALAVSNDALVIEVRALQELFQGLAIGVVSYAIQRGFQGFSSTPSSVNLAYDYLIKSLDASARNSVPLLTKTPHFLNLLMDSLKPKTVPCGAGKVTYKYNITTNFVTPNWFAQMTSGGFWAVGDPSSTLVNGMFPQMQAPASYSDEAAAVSLNSMYQFLSTTASRGDMTALEHAERKTIMMDDVSGYAICGGDPGNGYAGYGAPRSVVSLEVPIRSPVFSVMNQVPGTTVSLARSAAFLRAHGGDLVSLGGMMAGLLHEKQLHFKTPPVYKALDAQEFYDQIAYLAQSMVQYALSDLQINQQFASATATPADYICPLTFQEFRLLFRNVMLLATANSQYFAQGLVFQPSTIPQATFQTYKVACGTFAQSAISLPKLPVSLIEEINCNTMRVNTGGRGGIDNPNMIIPVVGEYIGEGLSGDDYVATYMHNEQVTTINVFRDPPTVVNGKERVSAETAISLIDGGFGGSNFAYINDAEALNGLCVLWNDWYAKLSAFVDTSDTYACDGGVSVLNQTIMTTHFTLGPPSARLSDPRFRKLLVNNGYARKKVAGVTAAEKMLSEAQQVTSDWIRPTNYLNDIGQIPSEGTGFQKMATVNREPFELNVTTGGFVTSSLGVYHSNFARTVTHARNGDDSAMTKFVLKCRENGQGGVLSTLANAFIPVAGVALSQLANAVPY